MSQIKYAIAAADIHADSIPADRADGRFTAMTEIVPGDVQSSEESATDHSFGELECGETADSRETVTCKLDSWSMSGKSARTKSRTTSPVNCLGVKRFENRRFSSSLLEDVRPTPRLVGDLSASSLNWFGIPLSRVSGQAFTGHRPRLWGWVTGSP